MAFPYKQITLTTGAQTLNNAYENTTFDLSAEVPFNLLSCNVTTNQTTGARYSIGVGTSPSDTTPIFFGNFNPVVPNAWSGLTTTPEQTLYVTAPTLFFSHYGTVGSRFMVNMTYAPFTRDATVSDVQVISLRIPTGTVAGTSFVLLTTTQTIQLKSVYIPAITAADQARVSINMSESGQLFPMTIAVGATTRNFANSLFSEIVVPINTVISARVNTNLTSNTYVYLSYLRV